MWFANFLSDSIVLATGQKSLFSLNLKTSQTTKIPSTHTRTIRKFDHFDKLLATCSFDSTVNISSCTDFSLIATLEGHENEVKDCKFNGTGEYLATCGRDKSVWVWELVGESDFECVAVLQDHTQDVKAIAWSPIDLVLISASYDDSINVYKEDGDSDWFLVSSLKGYHTSTVWDVSFSKDGKHFASCSLDESLKIWSLDYNTGECIVVQSLDHLHVRGIFSCDWGWNDIIATCGGDGSICLLKKDANGIFQIVERIKNAHSRDYCDLNSIRWKKTEGDQLFCTTGDDDKIVVWKYTEK